MNIPFENPMLLVKETRLNAVGLVFVKAEGASRPVPVEMENRRVGEVVDIPGPSVHFTWWSEYGPAPVPGDWLDMRLTKLVHDEVYLSADEAVARDRLRRSEIEAAAVVLDEEGRVLRMDERLQFNTAGLRFLVVPHDEYARLYHLV